MLLETFGYKFSSASLSEVAEMHSLLTGNDGNQTSGTRGPIPPPLYAFSVASPKWHNKLKEDAPPPSLLAGQFYPGATSIDSNNEGNQVEIQFYLGPAGSGAPAHFHGHAVNSLAFGEKVNNLSNLVSIFSSSFTFIIISYLYPTRIF